MVESSPDLKKNRKKVSEWVSAEAYKEKWTIVERPNPVYVRAVFFMPKPPSVKRAYHTVAPDLDKLCRFLLDAITDAGNVFEDDSQVCELALGKVYSDKVGIYLKVTTNEPS